MCPRARGFLAVHAVTAASLCSIDWAARSDDDNPT